MVGSLSGLFSSTSTVMVCWSSSRTRSSSWVLRHHTHSTRQEMTRVWKTSRATSERRRRTSPLINSPTSHSLPCSRPPHPAQKCLEGCENTSELRENSSAGAAGRGLEKQRDSPPVMAEGLGVPPADRAHSVSEAALEQTANRQNTAQLLETTRNS